jgi:uncharacterized protein (TIGR02246 family)
VSSESDPQAIRRLLEVDYASSVNRGDASTYIELFADDVLWAVPNTPDARSRDEIEHTVGRVFRASRQQLSVTIDEIDVMGDAAFVTGLTTGELQRLGDGRTERIVLRVAWLVRRGRSGWRIARQIATPKPDASGT